MTGFRPSAGASPCPCGGGSRRRPLEACCGPLLRGERLAGTAEQLMRSRYSAFVLGDVDHLLRTHPPHGQESEVERRRALQASCRAVRWCRLDILATHAGGAHDLEGTVTFRAHYQQRGGGGVASSGVMEECSRFGREGGSLRGAWLYLEALSGAGRR